MMIFFLPIVEDGNEIWKEEHLILEEEDKVEEKWSTCLSCGWDGTFSVLRQTSKKQRSDTLNATSTIEVQVLER